MSDSHNDESEPWPTELRVLDAGQWLKVNFDDGVVGELSALRLRDASPSADKNRATLPPGKPLTIADVEQVGNYAVRLTFSDGHSTGIYTWRLLRTLSAS